MPIKPENQARYPDDWPQIRQRILTRARNACEWCGVKNSAPHPKTGSVVVLTIAHVYDRRPESVAEGNLAALCQKCHNRHDAWIRSHGFPLPARGAQVPVQTSLDAAKGGGSG